SSELAGDPQALLAFLAEHASSLEPSARASLGELPIFAARSGARDRSSALVDGAPMEAMLGRERVAALGLDDALIDPSMLALVDALGVRLGSLAALLETRVLGELVPDAMLAEQPEPFATREGLARLRMLARHLGLDPNPHALALDARGCVVQG